MITKEYRELNEKLHQRNRNYGVGGKFWIQPVKQWARSHGCKSVLDYGAGKGVLSKGLKDTLDVRMYDPCIPDISESPDKADLVVCKDVMEHVEREYVDDVLDHIKELAEKSVILSIAIIKSNKKLPDGRNCHITIEKPDWWLEKIRSRWSIERLEMKDKAVDAYCVLF